MLCKMNHVLQICYDVLVDAFCPLSIDYFCGHSLWLIDYIMFPLDLHVFIQ